MRMHLLKFARLDTCPYFFTDPLQNPTIKILGSCRTTPQQNPTPISYIVYELIPFFSSKGQWKSFMSHWPVAATKCCLRATICMQRIFPQPPVIRRKSGTGGAKKSGQMTGPIKPDKGPWNTRRGPRWLSPLSRTGSLAGLGLDGSQCPHLHTYCVYMHTKFVPAWCYWKLPLHLELAKRAVLCLSPKSKKKIIIKIKL